MVWTQRDLALRRRPRGVHLITDEVLAALPPLPRIGLCHLFLQHTSAALTINENADPTVRADLERWLDRVAPDGAPYFAHDDEGPDDMPAHVKCALLGCSATIPVRAGELALGTWQGIWLVEPRTQADARHLLLTVHGDG